MMQKEKFPYLASQYHPGSFREEIFSRQWPWTIWACIYEFAFKVIVAWRKPQCSSCVHGDVVESTFGILKGRFRCSSKQRQLMTIPYAQRKQFIPAASNITFAGDLILHWMKMKLKLTMMITVAYLFPLLDILQHGRTFREAYIGNNIHIQITDYE